MKNKSFPSFTVIFSLLAILLSGKLYAQHQTKLLVEVNVDAAALSVNQELTYFNESKDTLTSIVLNDWNNAYSDTNSLLGQRFSDEFVRSFHFSKEKERGGTNLISVADEQANGLKWSRPEIDLIAVELGKPLLPGQKIVLNFRYDLKIASDQFTRYGHDGNGNFALRNWFLSPARFQNHQFVRYSNANLDDVANGISDYELELKMPFKMEATSDLDELNSIVNNESVTYSFSGSKRNDFSLYIQKKSNFLSFRNKEVDVVTNLKDKKIDEIQKAIIVDRIVNFVGEHVGHYPFQKITVSETDYERNPFYGLNQLPAFLSPFPDDFLYELKFLKTYTNNFIKNSLHLDARKDNWIYDAIQMYVMMKYVEEFRPDSKMMGNLSKWKILRGYSLMNLQFNEQYSYYYLLMARKNLDQPLGDSKETLIRFNEKIASKYRAGLSLKYLDNYLEDSIVPKSIQEFYLQSKDKETDRADFERLLKAGTKKDINWFFRTVIESRDIIDYKFGTVTKTSDSITMNIKNRTGTTVPIPVYGLKDKKIIFKDWFENVQTDSTFTVPRNNVDKIVLNYRNEVPEFNLRNNWHSLKSTLGNDRPFRFSLLKDLENPHYNQIIYVPTLTYNYYDGLSPGIRFSNKTLLDKPITFDVNPVYSVKTQTLTGSFGFGINQYRRNSDLYNIRYGMGGSYYHYAPDAAYLKFNPSVTFNIREKNLRDNRKQGFNARYNMVRKDHSEIVIDSTENYSVFSASYYSTRTEVANHLNYSTGIQASGDFSKISGELQYRKLFDTRQFNIRFFAGTFLHNNTENDYFDFGVSNPNDYLFDYNLFGRSEQTGLLSQQIIMAEGGFKSKLQPDRVNQWIATTNLSFSIWNWIEAYGDAGFVKNHHSDAKFLYDSGIRLNLVTDYFELYFPVYSNNGWEIAQPHYNEKIRFVATFSPKTLINLFTRKWF